MSNSVALNINLAPSRRFLLLLLGMHGCALLLLLLLSMDWMLKAGVAFVAVVMAMVAIRQWRRLGRVTRLVIRGESPALVIDGRFCEMRHLRPPMVTLPMIILYLGDDQHHWTLPLFVDSLPNDDFRRLRVLLKCRRVAKPERQRDPV